MEKLDFLPTHGSHSTFSGESKSREKEILKGSIITEEQDEDDDDYYLYDEDPPPYDITEKLKEINSALSKETIPDGYHDRNRKVVFRENPVDFEIPPTPNYSSEEEDDGYGDSTETSDDLLDESNSVVKNSNPKLKFNPGYASKLDPTTSEQFDNDGKSGLDLAQLFSMQNSVSGSGPTTPNSVAEEIDFLFKCFSKLSMQSNSSQTFQNQNDITISSSPASLSINETESFIHEPSDTETDAQSEDLPHSAITDNENDIENKDETDQNCGLESIEISSKNSDSSPMVVQSEAEEIQQNSNIDIVRNVQLEDINMNNDEKEILRSSGLNNNPETLVAIAVQSDPEVIQQNDENLGKQEENTCYPVITNAEENAEMKDGEQIKYSETVELNKDLIINEFNGNLSTEQIEKSVMPLFTEFPNPTILEPLVKPSNNSQSKSLLKWKRAMRQLHNVRQAKYVGPKFESINVSKLSQGSSPKNADRGKNDNKIQIKKRLLLTRPSTSSLAFLKEKSSTANFEETMVMASRGKFQMMKTEDFQSSKMAGKNERKVTKPAAGQLKPISTVLGKLENNRKIINPITSMTTNKVVRNKALPLKSPNAAKSRPHSVNWPKEEVQRNSRGLSGSTFRLTPEQKLEKERKLQAIAKEHQQKLEKAKQEKQKRKFEVEEAYRDWLQCKKLQEPNLKKTTSEPSIDRKVKVHRAEAAVGGEAFRDWMQKKKMQKMEEVRISELKKKIEEKTLCIRKQEDNELAFRKWLLKKSRDDNLSALPARRKSSSTNHQLAHVVKWRTENFF